MTTWQKSFGLLPPAALAALLPGLTGLVALANTSLDLVEDALSAASAFYVQQSDPASTSAQVLVQQFKDLVTDLFSVGGYKIVVHPYIPGVGKGAGAFRSLSFPNCVDVICREFDDPGDSRRPVFSSGTEVEIITIIAGAPSPSLFASTIAALNALFSLKEFRLAYRRIVQALELEEERFIRKAGSRLPDWTSYQLRDFQQAGDLEKSLLSTVGMLDGYAKGADNILDSSADLVAKKKAQLTTLQNSLNSASNMFSGGLTNAGVYTMYAKAMGSQGVKNELNKATGGAGHELSFSAGLTMVAPYPGLDILKEILQL